ncbi:MAG: DEAD/DEAH box helicase [Kiritimatiellae bacterium]|nr:DEAD/DEAH box helicase [Kiritimatiellia bacterium]
MHETLYHAKLINHDKHSVKDKHSAPHPVNPVKRVDPQQYSHIVHKPHGVFDALIPQLQRAVTEEGYTTPTPIQTQTIPHLLAGRDILGCAQTGTGKTAAFILPILQYLVKHGRSLVRGQPRVLILAPTRELAAQIGESIRTYGRYLHIRQTVIFGGVGQSPQVKALERGVDILVATPGRLLDLMNQRYVRLNGVETFVLDEADRMLDMGFIHDIRKVIAALPSKRQSLFFSATLTRDALELARTMVHDAVHITITPDEPTVDKITQKVLFVDRNNKDALLVRLLRNPGIDKVLIFTRMKHQANKVVVKLHSHGITAAAIHSEKSQTDRTRALAGFKAGKVRVLVATDIASRGIDVDRITHVINYNLPNESETYVHRIGRTARAGAEGDAVSFCCAEDRDFLRDIERLIRKQIPVDLNHPYHSETARNATGAAAKPPPRHQQGQQGRSHKFQRSHSQYRSHSSR